MAPRKQMTSAELAAALEEAKEREAQVAEQVTETRDTLVEAIGKLEDGSPEDVAEVRGLFTDHVRAVRSKWAAEGKPVRTASEQAAADDKAPAKGGKPEDGTAPAAPGATGGTQNSAKGGISSNKTKAKTAVGA